MSQRVWCYDKDKQEYVHALDACKEESESYVCPECGQRVICCQGEKNEWYFRHYVKSRCVGGSSETLLHKLAKQFLTGLTTFYVPSIEEVFKKDQTVVVLKEQTIRVSRVDLEKSILGGDLRPDAIIEGTTIAKWKNVQVCVEITVHHGVNQTKMKKYRRYIAEQEELGNTVYVIEVNLDKFTKDFDAVLPDEIKTSIVNESPYKITRLATGCHVDLAKDRFQFQNGYVCCPAYDKPEYVVDTKYCKSCPFFVSRSGNMNICYGKKAYAKPKDVLDGQTKEYRMDIYSEMMPKHHLSVVDTNVDYPLGSCSCGGQCRVGTGYAEGVRSFKGIIKLPRDTVYAYKWCTVCGKVTPITCPDCGAPMKLLRNPKNGKVFLYCTNNESDGEDRCLCSLTLFTDDSCGYNYADEVIGVGGLDNFLSGKKKYRDALMKIRHKA